MAIPDNSKTQTLYKLGTAFFWLATGLFAYALVLWVASWKVFTLRTIQVTGDVRHVTPAQVRLVSERVLKGNFFTVDMDAARQGFERLPWVREAKVARIWPSTLTVYVTENTPFAHWGSDALVNTQGDVFEAQTSGRLPQFSGPEGTSRQVMDAYQQFGQILAPLGTPIESINLSARLAWRLKLANGLELAVGRDDATQRLMRFASQYPVLEATLKGQLSYVDLRYPDGFAVRLAPTDKGQAGHIERG
jgi:cell division protein FtsQ